MRLAVALLWLVISISCASAQVGLPWPGPGTVHTSSSYTGPGDITSFTHWYGLRAYSAAVAAAGTQPLLNIRRASDTHNCDILVATNGGFGNTSGCSTGGDNGQSASSFCNATTCTATKVYDQVGSFNPAQGTVANQPTLVFNCVNTTLPCLQSTSATILLQTPTNFTPTTAVQTVSGVANRSSGTGSGVLISSNNTTPFQLKALSGSANTWSIGASVTVTANDAAWHAGNAVVNGASSVINVDGTEGTGTDTGNTTAGQTLVSSAAASTTLLWATAGYIDATAATLTIRSKLCANMTAYYGITPGTHCNTSGT